MKGSIFSIESSINKDGPGLRVVVFLNGCNLRCKYCHNPESWKINDYNYTVDELVNKILKYKSYFKNNGGVTFSGGEPLLQNQFLTEVCKKLKEHNINITIDTAGYGTNYKELLDYVDIVIYDIKDITQERYLNLTGGNINTTLEFLSYLKESNKSVIIRQVIVPGIHDNNEYINDLSNYIDKNFNKDKILKIDFLPYHKFGSEKYAKLNIFNPYENMEAMNIDKCNLLYKDFMKIYENKK